MPITPDDIAKSIQDNGSWASPESVADFSSPTADISIPSQPPAAQTWGQVFADPYYAGKSAIEQQIGGIESYAGSFFTDPAQRQAWDASSQSWKKAGQEAYQNISPAGRAITEAPLFSGETVSHPFEKTIMGVAKGGLWNAPALIPGGGYLAMGARLGLGAGLGVSGAYSDISDTIKSQPDDQLQKTSETYRGLREIYPEYDAKRMLVDQAWGGMDPAEKAAIVGTSALAGEAGPLATVGKTVSSAGGKTLANLASGRIARTAIGAAETGGVQAGFAAGTAIPTRDALTNVGVPTDQDITTGIIEQGTIGAIAGGLSRGLRRPPIAGENATGVTTSKMLDPDHKFLYGDKLVKEVPAGQPDPAAAEALKSNTSLTPVTGYEAQYPPPPPPKPPTGFEEKYTPPPPPAPTPKPPFVIPPAGTQRPLGLPEGVPQPPQRQPELPLERPQSPGSPQGELFGAQPRQPITQLGLPGMGADVTHAPGETIERPSETPPPPPPPSKPPEEPPVTPAPAPTKGPKAKVTKVSEPEPAEAAAPKVTKVSDLPPAVATAIDKAKNVGDVVKALKKVEKDVKAPSIEQAKIIADWKARMLDGKEPSKEPPEEPPTTPKPPKPKPLPGEAKAGEPTEPTAPTKPPKAAKAVATSTAKEELSAPTDKGAIKFDELKQKLAGKKVKAPTETPTETPPTTKKEARRQAAIAKLTEKKAQPTQIERPTIKPISEPKVTVLPPSDARLKPITPSPEAIAKAQAAVAALRKPLVKTNSMRTVLEGLGYTHDDFNKMKLAEIQNIIREGKRKEGTEAPATGKVAAAIKGVLPLKAQKAIDAAKKIEGAKKNVHPNPTDAQKVAGNYPQGHPPASATQGQPVTITTPAGKEGEAEGRIRGTSKNIPKEPLETIIGSPNDTGRFYVINKVHPTTGEFDGHIAVQGKDSMGAAAGTYFDKVSRDTGVDRKTVGQKELINGIVEMTPEEFEHFKQNRNPNEPVYPSTEGKHPFAKIEVPDKTGSKWIDTLGSSTIKTALEEILQKLPHTFEHSIYRRLAQQAIKYIPDVPLYYVRQPDLDRAIPGANAVYSSRRNYILRGTRIPSEGTPETVLLHEVMHASSVHLYEANSTFRDRVGRVFEEYVRATPTDDIPYTILAPGQIPGKELIGELANPVLAKQLAQIPMSDLLVKELDMENWAKSTKTLWGAVVKAFKDGLEALGFNIPGKDNMSKFTLLEGLLRLTDEGFMARSKEARTDFAKMNRAMQSHSENLSAHIEQEHNSQQNISNTFHRTAQDPEKLEAHYDSERKSISDRINDVVAKAPSIGIKQKQYEYIIPLQGTDSFRMGNERYFGPLNEMNPMRRWVETHLRRDSYHSALSSAVNNIVREMYKQFRGHTRDEINHFGDTLGHATAYRIDPRYKIGEGTNAWLKAPGWQWRNEAKQAIANHDRITRMYNQLSPDLKQRFGQLVDDYHKAGLEHANMAVDELIHSIVGAGPKFVPELKTIDPNDPKMVGKQEYIKWHNDWEQNFNTNKNILREHLLKGELTENEEDWLKGRGFDDISDIHNLANPRGPYVPLDHGGEFIINARYKIDPPKNGTQVKGIDNAFDFKTPEEAEEFLNKQPPRSRMSAVYFNDKGEETTKNDSWQKPDGSMGFAKDNQRYRVEVNDKYYSGHASISEAKKRYQLLKESGAFAKIAEPQSKQSGWYSGLEIASPLFRHLMAEVAKRTDYTDAQKTAVTNLLRDAALSSMEGNRIAKHLMERKAVAGWDTDYIKTYKSYFDAHNALMSRAKFAKDLNGATNDLIDYAKNHEFESGQTDRSLILKELNKRDQFFGSPNHIEETEGNRLGGRVLKYLEATSFFANMVSPGHLITHQTHQFLTYDLAAAKYGPMKAMAKASKLHSTLAGTGFKNVINSIGAIRDIITKDSEGLNYVEGLMNKIGKDPRYGKELTTMLNEAIATNRLHPDQGFDASVLHMGSGKLERGLARLDLASRQMMGATEAYSRVWGYSLVYMLARDAGESVEQATRTAFDSVSRTQGLLSRSNMSSVMNKWYMRAPMQFRGWGLNMMFTLANNIYNIFKPDAPGVRAEAIRRLLYLFGSTAALTGINGLPSDPMRVGLALAGAMGLTNYNWADAQEEMRKKFVEATGSVAGANLLMDGLLGSLGPFSFFGADRVGFGSLAVFGEPDSYDKGDIAKWILQIAGGAPYEELTRPGELIDGIKEGDYAKAAKAALPLKIIDDWVKAWQGAREGIPTKTGVPGMAPYSAGETFMQSMGLTPARRERYREMREAEYRGGKEQRDQETELLNAVGTSRQGPERMRALQQISAYNQQNPSAPITPHDVMKALRRQTVPSIAGKVVTKRNRTRLQELQEMYGQP